ncbi:MAG: phosphodiester glycosidase family protein, partial [Clostridia bacterium]|nr:phosphodiester glycosidase family protein [Clostridia bacterium]
MKKLLKHSAALVLCALMTVSAVLPVSAFKLDGQETYERKELADGVTLTHVSTAESSVYGLQNMNVLEIDPTEKVSLDVIGAGQYANDRDTVMNMISGFKEANPDLTPVAAVNGDLWMMGSAHSRVEGSGTSYGGYSDPVVKNELTLPRGFNMYGGEIICSQYMYTETPYEGEFWSLLITKLGRLAIACPVLGIAAEGPAGAFTVDGFNRLPADNSLVLYSDKGCLSNYALDDAYELLIDCGTDYTVYGGSVISGTVAEIFDSSSDEDPVISETTMILTARGSAVSRVSSLKKGDEVSFEFEVSDRYGRYNDTIWDDLECAVGGHMPFVVDGVKQETGTTKGYPSTIVGITNGGKCVIIANDGRQPGFSRGLDFNDYAALADQFDLNTGFILDGGGSTEMVALDGDEYKVVNRPSDGRERKVINSLILSVGKEGGNSISPLKMPSVPADLSSLYFYDSRASQLVSTNIQSKIDSVSQGLFIKADKYNGSVIFNVNYGLPQTTAKADEKAYVTEYPSISVDEYPFIVLDMKAVTSDASSFQFQSVYVSAGDRWSAYYNSETDTNFVGFNNLINDGEFHRYVFDTRSNPNITGNLNSIRIGYLLEVNGVGVKDGDGVILRSVRLAKTAEEAENYRKYAYPFKDVPYVKWYTKAVDFCYDREYMAGVSATEFGPKLDLTRAMIVTILARMAGADLSGFTGKVFDDVPTGKWYSKPIAWANSEGLAAGMGGGIFAPNAPVTREQFATFLLAYAKYSGSDTSGRADITGYNDYAKISKWARNAVS